MSEDAGKATEIDHTIAALRGELLDIENQREKTFELLQKVDAASDYVAKKLNELENRHGEIKKELDERTAELAFVKAQAQSIRDSDQDFEKLTAALKARLRGMTFTNFVRRSRDQIRIGVHGHLRRAARAEFKSGGRVDRRSGQQRHRQR